MPKYNLNERQRRIVRSLVEVHRDGYDDDFEWFEELGSQPVIQFVGRSDSIEAKRTDLITLEKEQFVTLSWDTDHAGCSGTLRQRAYDAVDSDFEQTPSSPAGSGMAIANYIQTMTGGNVQGAVGSEIQLSQSSSQDKNTTLGGNVLVRMGDLFEGAADLTVLPCSAKGTVSKATRRWSEIYGLPLPTEISSRPRRLGDISDLIPFSGSSDLTKYVIYAASVLNDYSKEEEIRSIAAKIGALTQTNSEIRVVQAPLLGTGAGKLRNDVACKALFEGFRSTAHPDAILYIFAFDSERQTALQSVLDGLTSNVTAAKPPTQTRGILFLAADPTDQSRLRLGEEFREIQQKLKVARLRDHFRLELPQLSVRPEDISQALLDTLPQIVHFAGHGTLTGELYFENHLGKAHPVQPEALAALFEHFVDDVDCVLLNACYSEPQAQAIARHIKYVIGMNQEIGDKTAIAFVVGFYQALGAGRTIEIAYKLGCVQIGLHGIPEHLTPVLIKKE